MLHEAIVEREEQGETLSRFLPGGLAEKLRRDGSRSGESDKVTVTVLMSDVRGYSTISEISDPGILASQLNEHRAQMNRAVVKEGGTVMQFIGDAGHGGVRGPRAAARSCGPSVGGGLRHALSPRSD